MHDCRHSHRFPSYGRCGPFRLETEKDRIDCNDYEDFDEDGRIRQKVVQSKCPSHQSHTSYGDNHQHVPGFYRHNRNSLLPMLKRAIQASNHAPSDGPGFVAHLRNENNHEDLARPEPVFNNNALGSCPG